MKNISIRQNVSDLGRFLTSLFGLIKRRNSWGTFMKIYEESQFDSGFSRSYSQFAEDLVLNFYLQNEESKTYVDVGCNDPNRFSNTRLLYERGWTGVNIDANSQFSSSYIRHRPKDAFVAALIGNGSKDLKYYFFEETALNTTDKQLVEKHLNSGWKLERTEIVPVVSLRSIINRYFPNGQVTLLNVDCEGAELDVLESIDLENTKPKWILVEANNYSIETRDMKIPNYLESYGYKVVCSLPQSTLMRFSPRQVLV